MIKYLFNKDHFLILIYLINSRKNSHLRSFFLRCFNHCIYIFWKTRPAVSWTGCGPEGIQLLCITHPHLTRLMNKNRLPFLAFADYDVAPHGFNDYFDALQMFCSVDTLGMGIGNVDRDYPKFAIPSLWF